MSDQPHVVYLTGWGRSGSTVLNRLLVGEGVVGVGELRLLWQRGVAQRQHCSCGKVWDECVLWSPVVRSVLGDQPDVSAAARRLHDLGQRAGRAVGRHPRRIDGAAREYAELLGSVYRSIADVTGARLVVDSSKSPMHALLARASGVEATVVHLVRDPRGVVWSHQRAKSPPPGAEANTTEQHGPAYVSTRWLIRNSFIDRHVEPDLRIRYEDLVTDTDAVVSSIFATAGLEVPAWDGGVEHLIAGNPNRFDRARPTVLREDAEWREAQPERQKRLTKLIAGRLMERYGYR